ncbi:DUF6082 family protein [Streptomyces sp. NPDC050804]|uniref:DUF6082 family protein n=1 Tax=unclassified Streptomyces TaxID=2593676 RepID=UPI00343AA391|nr:DUF6082 family protein [Streptomyces sp. NBC_00872]
MKTSHAVLVAAAVGVVRLVQSERQNRRRLALHAEEMHQAWISEEATNPELQAAWMSPGGEPPTQEHTNLLHANRLISFLSVKFRAGLLDRHALRVQARWLMEREVARTYWKKFGGFRKDEAMDRTDHTFNSVLDEEYGAITDDTEPVAA